MTIERNLTRARALGHFLVLLTTVTLFGSPTASAATTNVTLPECAAHHFHGIKGTLTLLVVFAPAESSGA